MSEQSPADLSEWHNGKKTRISDIAKAQLVAQAMKPYEDESAAIRYVTEKTMIKPHMSGGANNFEQEIDFTDAGDAEGYMSEDPFNEVHGWKAALNLLDDVEGGINSLTNRAKVKEIAEEIQLNNRDADDAAEVVADAYDKLEATKR